MNGSLLWLCFSLVWRFSARFHGLKIAVADAALVRREAVEGEPAKRAETITVLS